MPKIEISEATFKRLQQKARPLIDSTDDVINFALDTLESRGNSNITNVTNDDDIGFEVDINDLPDFKYTKVLNAKINGIGVVPNFWNNVLQSIIKVLLRQGETLDALNMNGDMGIIKGKVLEGGYKYIPNFDFSMPPKDANKVVGSIVKLAVKYQVKLNIQFLWRSNKESAYPGKVSHLRIN